MSNCCNCRRNCNCNSMNNGISATNIMTSNNGFTTSCNGCNTCNSCSESQSTFPSNYLYGHAYTPVQTLNETFNPQLGLQNGTIFPELVSSYYPGQSMDFINSLRNGGCQNG